jgi:glycosyltransferase involved in cell wall biosynthesis
VTHSALMLVSARADESLREEVAGGYRPEPEYLRLESRHAFELLDWTALGEDARHRSPRLALRHVSMALGRLERYDAVLADGEHLGAPLAVGIKSRRIETRHAMIGHHLTPQKKRLLFGAVRWALRDSSFIVHCEDQARYARDGLGIAKAKVALVPYGIDLDFWHPLDREDEGFVMASGKDHRDYVTFAQACDGAVDRAFVAGSSLHSAGALCRVPTTWPDGFATGFVDFPTLRDRYASCALFVLPLLATDFQAGVTALLEAMAMGKAVIATSNSSVREVVVDGETGVLVPPGDPAAMRAAIVRLLADPGERARLGRNARDAVEVRHGLDDYASRLDAVTKGAVHAPAC